MIHAVEIAVLVFVETVVGLIELQVVVLIAFEQVIRVGGRTEDPIVAHIVHEDLLRRPRRVAHRRAIVDDVVSVGEEITVKVIDVDESGDRIKLSRKAMLSD